MYLYALAHLKAAERPRQRERKKDKEDERAGSARGRGRERWNGDREEEGRSLPTPLRHSANSIRHSSEGINGYGQAFPHAATNPIWEQANRSPSIWRWLNAVGRERAAKMNWTSSAFLVIMIIVLTFFLPGPLPTPLHRLDSIAIVHRRYVTFRATPAGIYYAPCINLYRATAAVRNNGASISHHVQMKWIALFCVMVIAGEWTRYSKSTPLRIYILIEGSCCVWEE